MKSLRKPDAIMFDVYDTLFLNDTNAWKRAFQQIAEEHGFGFWWAHEAVAEPWLVLEDQQ